MRHGFRWIMACVLLFCVIFSGCTDHENPDAPQDVVQDAFTPSEITLIDLFAALMGGAGFMEYWVQRHGHQALFSYSVMSVCLIGMIVLTCLVRGIAVSWERKKTMVETDN